MNIKVIVSKRYFLKNKIIIGLNNKFKVLDFSNFSLGSQLDYRHLKAHDLFGICNFNIC